MISPKEFLQHIHVCQGAMLWIESQPTLEAAWNKCGDPDWLLQALEPLELIPTWQPRTMEFALWFYEQMLPEPALPDTTCLRLVEGIRTYDLRDGEDTIRQLTLVCDETRKQVQPMFDKNAWQMWCFRACNYYNIRALAKEARATYVGYWGEMDESYGAGSWASTTHTKAWNSKLLNKIKTEFVWSEIEAACNQNILFAQLP